MPRAAAHSAAVRRETGAKPVAEDRAGIEQVGVGDDPLAQAGHRLVDQRQNQPVLEIRREPARSPPCARTGLPSRQRVEALRRSCGRASSRRPALDAGSPATRALEARAARISPTCRPHPARPRRRARSAPSACRSRRPARRSCRRGMPSSSANMASFRYGISIAVDHESRGAAARQRQLVDAAREAGGGLQRLGARALRPARSRSAASARPG